MITNEEKSKDRKKSKDVVLKLKSLVAECQTLYEVWPNLKIYRPGKYSQEIMDELREKYKRLKPIF